MSIDFFDKIRSTRADGKLFDADAIDGRVPKDLLDLDFVTEVDDLHLGRLRYQWWFSTDATQTPFASRFRTSYDRAARSEFLELTIPDLLGLDTLFGFVAVPLNEPEPEVRFSRGFGNWLESQFRRIREPFFIGGVPHRVWVSFFPLQSRIYSNTVLTLSQLLRLSRYERYAIATDSITPPQFGADIDMWNVSNGPVVSLGDWAGQDRYVHFAIPTGVAPTPTLVMRSEDGAANLASATVIKHGFTVAGVHLSTYTVGTTRLPAADWSGSDLIILPERDGIEYYTPPTVLPNEDVGFTWYMGFYSWPTSQLQDENPVDAAVIMGSEAVSSTTQQLTTPGTAPGRYQPDTGRFYCTFVAQPSNAAAITGLQAPTLRNGLTYTSLPDIQTAAETAWTDGRWTEQTTRVDIGGTEHTVWLERRATNRWSSAEGGRLWLSYR